jgi:hypothetical protein
MKFPSFSFHLRRSPLNLSAAGTTTVSDVERLQGIKERLEGRNVGTVSGSEYTSALKDFCIFNVFPPIFQELINDVRTTREISKQNKGTFHRQLLDFAIPHDPTVDFKQASFRDSSPELVLLELSGPVRSHSCSEQCRLCSSSRRNRGYSSTNEFIPHLRNLLLYHVVSGSFSLVISRMVAKSRH